MTDQHTSLRDNEGIRHDGFVRSEDDAVIWCVRDDNVTDRDLVYRSQRLIVAAFQRNT